MTNKWRNRDREKGERKKGKIRLISRETNGEKGVEERERER